MTGALWLAAICLLPLCGFPLLSHPAFRRFPIPSRVVLSGAAGAVFLSAAMTGSVLLGRHWNESLVAAAAVLLAAALRLILGKERSQPRPAEPLDPWTFSAHALAALAVCVAFVAARAAAATSPDLFFFWGVKAQQFAAARTIDVPFLQDFFHRYMHLYYPPLLTNVYAFATMAAGRLPWTAAILTFPLLLAALAVSLPGLLGTFLTRRAAASYSSLGVAAIAYAGIEADIGGNGEMPLLVFETLAVALLISPDADAASTQLLAGLLLAGAVTTKVEGMPFALAAILLFLGLARKRRVAAAYGRAREVAAASRAHHIAATTRLLAPLVVCLGAWFLFGATRHLFAGYAAEGRLFDLYPARLPSVARLATEALGATGWGLPWLLPLAVLLASAVALGLRADAAIPLGTAAALTGFFLFTYLHREENPTLWISWSAPRIFIAVAVLLVIAAACSRGSGSPIRDTAARSRR